jgi:hypothetical protein
VAPGGRHQPARRGNRRRRRRITVPRAYASRRRVSRRRLTTLDRLDRRCSTNQSTSSSRSNHASSKQKRNALISASGCRPRAVGGHESAFAGRSGAQRLPAILNGTAGSTRDAVVGARAGSGQSKSSRTASWDPSGLNQPADRVSDGLTKRCGLYAEFGSGDRVVELRVSAVTAQRLRGHLGSATVRAANAGRRR